MRFLLAVLLVAVSFSACKEDQSVADPYVVMLSMDGFRWDYTDGVPTPNFDKIARSGVKARSLKPAFPTKTFPNHYTIATGLYPDHHGIVLNSFYDEPSGRYYAISDRDAVEDGYFYGGEPIWVTAENQGLISGSYFWVGSEAEIGGCVPTYTKKYDAELPYQQRIDSVISWLQKPEDVRPHLVLWYLDEPDHTGHDAGPDSRAVDSLVIRLDSLLGVFLEKLERLPIADKVNVIVTSDHGMGNISNDRKVALSEHLKKEWIKELQGINPNFNILAENGFEDSIYQALIHVEGIKTWKTGTLPERLNYGTHPRTLDLVVVADSSWSVVWDRETVTSGGAHGFDNENTDMHAIFYAFGPAFKENYECPPFENVNIYPLICEILGLLPAPVDGNLEPVKELLK